MTRNEKIELQKKIMTEFMDYIRKDPKSLKEKQLFSKVEDTITKIIQLENEEMKGRNTTNLDKSDNSFDLKFTYDSEQRFLACYNVRENCISCNVPRLICELESKNEFGRLEGCKKILQVIFHEIQHYRQNLMIQQNVSNKNVLGYARDLAIINNGGGLFYQYYYDSIFIENNADAVGYEQSQEILGARNSDIKLLNIAIGNAETSRYPDFNLSDDGEIIYGDNGLMIRDDVTVSVLDKLICSLGKIEILEKYPILQKEYNLDGTKKTEIELIKNMKKEIQEILQNQDLTETEKKELTTDAQQMYYELIYRQIEKHTPEQIMQITKEIGKEETKDIFSRMSHYFQSEKEFKMTKLEEMTRAKCKGEDFQKQNNGTVAVEKDGQIVEMTCDEILKILDPQLIQDSINIVNEIPEIEHYGEDIVKYFIEKELFDSIPANGQRKVEKKYMTPKEFIEYYMETIIPNFKMFYHNEIYYWIDHIENSKKIEEYYGQRQDTAKHISESIITSEFYEQDVNKEITTISPQNIVKTTIKNGVGMRDILNAVNAVEPKNRKSKNLEMSK